MKSFTRCLLAALFVSAAGAHAADCVKTCSQVSEMCDKSCKDLKKQGKGDKVSFCQQKCKEFEDVCQNKCQSQPKKK